MWIILNLYICITTSYKESHSYDDCKCNWNFPGGLPYQENAHAQDHGGMDSKREMYDEMILWIQASSGHKNQEEYEEFADEPLLAITL